MQTKCAERERDKELLSQQAAQITDLENAKGWLERRLNETEVCLCFCYIELYFCQWIFPMLLRYVVHILIYVRVLILWYIGDSIVD